MKLYICICLTIGYLIPDQTVHAQQTKHVSEKVYVHPDRQHYVAGDTLWFNAYLADAIYHQPRRVISTTLHLALLDPTGQPRLRQSLWLDSLAQGAGQFALPDSLPSGTYQLLAYTPDMLLHDSASVCRQPLLILARQRADTVAAPVTPTYSLRLFPEGGQMVAGLPGRMAFQAADQFDRSADVRGHIVSDRGDTLTDFASMHRGRGVLTLTPQPGRSYRAVATVNGQAVTCPLPAALPEGHVLTVDNLTSGDIITVDVQNTQLQAGQLTLFAHVRGVPSFQTPLAANKPRLRVAIPRSLIGQDGILQITLFDPQNRPVAERLVFVESHTPPSVTLFTDQPTYQQHQMVTVRMQVSDSSGKPLATRLSVAVVDARQDPVVERDRTTLRSTLLLTSDLRGYIEAPDEYFDPANPRRGLWVDLLLLTHGWRRFTWGDLLSSAPSTPASATGVSAGLSWQGVATQPLGSPLRGETLRVLIKSGSRLTEQSVQTDGQGRFMLSGLRFADTATIIVRSRYNRPLRVALTRAEPVLPAFAFRPMEALSLAEEQMLAGKADDAQAFFRLLRERGAIQLAEVRVKGLAPGLARPDPRRILYGKADHTVIATDQMRSMPNVGQMIAGRVPGVIVTYDNEGNPAVIARGAGVAIMIDGILVNARNALTTISPNDIDAIDVIINPGTNGALPVSTGGQAINILTLRGSDIGKKINDAYATVQGYTTAREFYAPQYATTPPPRPDRRATLYWNPAVQTDAEGKATLRFFNSDETTTVRIIAEGLTPDGQMLLGKGQYTIEAVSPPK